MSGKISTNIQQQYIFLSNSPTMTFNFGKRVGKRLAAGSVIALMGELGCGKTLFTKGICFGLDIPVRQVNSPTFVLVNEYRGKLPVFHMDLYRLENVTEELEIGLLDYLSKVESGIMVVEWAEKMLSLLPDDCLQVHFQALATHKRQIVLSGSCGKFNYLFAKMGAG